MYIYIYKEITMSSAEWWSVRKCSDTVDMLVGLSTSLRSSSKRCLISRFVSPTTKRRLKDQICTEHPDEESGDFRNIGQNYMYFFHCLTSLAFSYFHNYHNYQCASLVSHVLLAWRTRVYRCLLLSLSLSKIWDYKQTKRGSLAFAL